MKKTFTWYSQIVECNICTDYTKTFVENLKIFATLYSELDIRLKQNLITSTTFNNDYNTLYQILFN